MTSETLIRKRKAVLRRSQLLFIDAGPGVKLEVEKLASGAVELRNAQTGSLLRQWSPKEAKTP